MKGSLTEAVNPIYHLLKTGLSRQLSDLSEKAYRSVQKIAISHHLVLLQNIVALYGSQFSEIELKEIKNLTSRLLPSLGNDGK